MAGLPHRNIVVLTPLAAMLMMPLTACSQESELPEAAGAQTAQEGDPGEAPLDSDTDATVAGTEYNATTLLDCGFDGESPTQTCEAGVIRNWGEDGTHLVEVTKPDGFTRALFFNGTTPTGADSAEADGSAGWEFAHSVDGDRITVVFGPETYVIVDALIVGG